jgi:hypothetical protein
MQAKTTTNRFAAWAVLSMHFLLFATLGCNSSAAEDPGARALSSRKTVSNPSALPFDEADLQGLEKGWAREAALVRAARQRGNEARTPEERAKASQDEWEEQTIPGGAQAAGLSIERYRNVRKTVNRVLETLDFQGKINGPLEIDVEYATPELKQRLTGDPFDELSPASAAALRAHMNRLVPVWVQYMQLTALNG